MSTLLLIVAVIIGSIIWMIVSGPSSKSERRDRDLERIRRRFKDQ